MSKTIKIGGRIESAERGGVVTGANAILDDTKGKKQNVINSETDDELARLDNAKQDVLTFDNAPTEGSNNPVKSGGVYAADAVLQQTIEAILQLIPSAATALNQLADKAFVNSTVATDTATFRGTYNVVTDLSLHYNSTHQEIATALLSVVQTADNNDYCFVQIPVSDSSGDIRVTERYKFNGTAWSYEYDLNNSGFTADQWAAINSTITLALVQKLGALPTAAELAQQLALKQNTLTFDMAPVAGSSNPVTSGGLYNIIAAINATIPSGASVDNKLVSESRLTQYVAAIVNALDATFNVTSTDGHVNVRLTQVDGAITSVEVVTNDIASASALNTLAGRVTTNEGDIAQLQALYNALQQSAPVIIQPTDTWPVASPSATVIYRVIDRVNTPPQYYSDYMFSANDLTTPVLMAQYNNAIDDVPTAGSANLVTSGGVSYDSGVEVVESTVATAGVQVGYNEINIKAEIKNGDNVTARISADEGILQTGNGYLYLRKDGNIVQTVIYPAQNEDIDILMTSDADEVYIYYPANSVIGSGTVSLLVTTGMKRKIYLERKDLDAVSENVDELNDFVGDIFEGNVSYQAGITLNQYNNMVNVDIPANTPFDLYIDADGTDLEYGYLIGVYEDDSIFYLIYYPDYINHPDRESYLNKKLSFTYPKKIKALYFYYVAEWVKGTGTIVLHVGYGEKLNSWYLNNIVNIGQIQGDVTNLKTIVSQHSGAINELLCPFYKNGVFWSHMHAGVSENELPDIPSQSLYDIQASARLGFKFIEANVHQTSDGKYVVIHGYQGKFWWYVEGVNGEDIHDIAINTKTLAWIKENVRYRTSIARYKTSILSLQEFCEECRKWNIMPSVQCINEEVYNIARGYFGDAFAVYGDAKVRDWGWGGLIMPGYLPFNANASLQDNIDSAISFLNVIGAPCFGNIRNDNATILIEGGNIKEYVAALHKAGFQVSCAGNYSTQRDVFALADAGVDMLLSASNVNDFEYGNITDLTSDDGYGAFTIEGGTVGADGVLTFSQNGAISISSQEQPFIGKGSLHIEFSGTIEIPEFSFGQAAWINASAQYRTFSSENGKYLSKWMSTYFFRQALGFTLNITAGTSIKLLTWKASKV